MARDTRLWQDSLAHVKHFTGDESECNKWYAWAKLKLGFMLRSTPGPTTQVFAPVEGVSIKVDTRPNRISISTDTPGLYVETGFMNVVSSGQCSADTYRPSVLEYNGEVSTLMDAQDTPMQGKVTIAKSTNLTEFPFSGEELTSGSLSKSLGCSSFADEITVYGSCGQTFTGGGFCDLTLYDKKRAANLVASSNYTGKLKLYVQAMYGSTRKDYARSEGDSLKVLKDLPDEYALLHSTLQSSWLLTFPNFTYAFCRVSGNSLVVTPLKVPAAAVKFASILADHPRKAEWAFATRIETYILAYALPDKDREFSVPIIGPSVVGSPLSYGWHSNWSGTQAHIVTFYADAPNQQYLAQQYRLDVAIGPAPGYAVSASVTKVVSDEPFYCFTGSGFNLFYYDDLSKDMMPVPKPASSVRVFNFEAPIYCFTKLDITSGECEINTVKIKRDLHTQSSYYYPGLSRLTTAETYTAYETFIPIAGSVAGDIGVDVVGNDAFSMIHTNIARQNYTKITMNLLYESPDWVSLTTSSPTFDNNPDWLFNLGWQAYGADGADYHYVKNYGQPSEQWAVRREKYLHYQKIADAYSTLIKSANYFIEAPKNDCSAIIIGELIDETASDHTYNEYTPGRHWWNEAIIHENFRNGPLGSVISEFTGELHVRGMATYPSSLNYTKDGFVGTTTFSEFTATESGYDSTVKQLVGLGPADEVFSSATLTADMQEYFSATLADPGIGDIDYAQSSIQSGSKVTHTLYSTNDGFINDASTGWA